MVQKQAKRNEQEWIELIQECRTSGLSDKEWCFQHGIPISTFYNRVTTLRKKACSIPAASKSVVTPSQQVVPITIIEENDPFSLEGIQHVSVPDKSHPAIILNINSCRMEINNHADKEIILNTLLALQQLC